MEEKELHQISLSIKIQDIKLIEFSALKDLPTKYADTELNKDKIQFEFNVRTHLEVQKKTIHIDLNTIFYAEEEKETILGNLNSAGDFKVNNMPEILKDFDGKFPNIAFANLIGVVLSTSRGFLIIKSEGTIMEGIIMPMINPNVFFQKQLDVKTDK